MGVISQQKYKTAIRNKGKKYDLNICMVSLIDCDGLNIEFILICELNLSNKRSSFC